MQLPRDVSEVTTHYLREVDRAVPGLVTGLYLHGSICWGEFYPESDVDFVAVLDHRPGPDEIRALELVQATVVADSSRAFDGFHCLASDLAKPAAECPPLPVFYQGRFQEQGDLDVNPVTWHELAERGITLRGPQPVDLGIHTDAVELRAFTRNNLDTYWRNRSEQLNQATDDEIGTEDWMTRWCVIGVARLHHLLTTGKLTSKSGAGRYTIERLPEGWQRIGREALRLREDPDSASLYSSRQDRGKDTRSFVAWTIEDGLAL
jgi:hypothetical protein